MSLVSMQNATLYRMQKQQELSEQSKKYNNSIAEYNMNKVIKYYTQAINSAESAGEAKYLAESLNSFLSTYGKSIDDVDGISNENLTDPAAAKAKKAHGKRGNAQDKEVIKDLSDEFGIDVKKRGTTKDWLALAKKDENVRILDKNGKDITAEREGRIKKGDILEVKSKKHGKVQIAVGGDGEINGGDDRVISMGGKTAANGIFHGLNEVNKVPQKEYTVAGGNGVTNLALNPFETQETELAKEDTFFTNEEIKHLMAAIMDTAIEEAEKKELKKQQQAA